MKAMIESAHDTGRSFQGNNGPVKVYEVVAGGQTYDCFSSKILDLVGKEADFEITPNKDPKYHARLTLPKDGGGKTFFGGGGGKGYGDPILTAKTMLMAYAKDMVVAKISKETSVYSVKEILDAAIALFDGMAKKIIPVAPPAPAPEQKHVESLSQAKQAIIMQKCKACKFSPTELVEFAGGCGLELKYDVANDRALIEQLDDQTAQHLINSLQDVLK